ncbi:DUF2953 domain-containing protein [Neobacillus bataviensis]|uniref:DUF2953 domain-containing protein n=1 Tax=Neobacillus bataviensis TaxID=220685 RepID=UPI001F1AFE33|nr:DUF2953 domain-containing protein [Neobacillus bataviensis]
MNKLFWLWLSLSILLFLFILIIFTKITILLNYYHHNDNDDLKVEFKIWFGLIKYKLNVPLIKIDDNSPSLVVKSHSHMGDSAAENPENTVNQITQNDVVSSFEKTKELLERVIDLHVIVRKFFKRVTIKNFEWQTLMGVGDAAHTGMLTGAIWAIKGSIVSILSHYFRLKEMPHLSVTPHFQAAVIQTQLTCMFQFRIGYAILAGLKMIKFWKGGKPRSNFKNEKTKSV